MGEPSSFELDQIEAEAERKCREAEASIGEIGENVELNFCNDCPLLGFSPEKIAGAVEGVGWSVDYPGVTVVTTQLRSREGRWSKEILLGTHPGNAITGKIQQKIYNDAAKRTVECDKPRKVPSFLGPLAIKKCPALEKIKNKE